MKFILSKKLEVLSFRVSSKELSYADKSKNLIFRNQIVTTNTSSTGYFLRGRYFFYGNETDYITRFVDLKTHKTMAIGYVGTPSEQLFDGEIFVTHEYLDLVDFKQQLISYNIKTNKKKVIKANVGAVLMLNKNVITREGAITIRSLSLLTGKYEWEVDLGEYGQIWKILGVEEGLLWVLTDGDIEREISGTILGIEPTTGQVIVRIPPRTELYNPYQTKFSEDRKSLFSIRTLGVATWLIEFNLPDLSVKRQVRLRQLEDVQIQIANYIIQDGFIYFTANTPHKLKTKFLCVMDSSNLTLLWHQKVIEGNESFVNQEPQVGGNKLYALDTGGTLHIFEKEEI